MENDRKKEVLSLSEKMTEALFENNPESLHVRLKAICKAGAER